MTAREPSERIRIRNVQLRTGKPHIATINRGYGPCWVHMPALPWRPVDDEPARRAANEWMRRVRPGWIAWRRGFERPERSTTTKE